MKITDHGDVLKKTVRDQVTGFTGTAISVTFFAWPCPPTVVIQPKMDGEWKDAKVFDCSRIEEVEDV